MILPCWSRAGVYICVCVCVERYVVQMALQYTGVMKSRVAITACVVLSFKDSLTFSIFQSSLYFGMSVPAIRRGGRKQTVLIFHRGGDRRWVNTDQWILGKYSQGQMGSPTIAELWLTASETPLLSDIEKVFNRTARCDCWVEHRLWLMWHCNVFDGLLKRKFFLSWKDGISRVLPFEKTT